MAIGAGGGWISAGGTLASTACEEDDLGPCVGSISGTTAKAMGDDRGPCVGSISGTTAKAMGACDGASPVVGGVIVVAVWGSSQPPSWFEFSSRSWPDSIMGSSASGIG